MQKIPLVTVSMLREGWDVGPVLAPFSKNSKQARPQRGNTNDLGQIQTSKEQKRQYIGTQRIRTQ